MAKGFSLLTAPNLSVCQLKRLHPLFCALNSFSSYSNRLRIQTDVTQIQLTCSLGAMASCPSRRYSVVTEAFILLFTADLFPYLCKWSCKFHHSQASKTAECMTCCISIIMCIGSNWQLWCSLPTKDTGTIRLVGNHAHSCPIWEMIVHIISKIILSFALYNF